MSLSPPKIEDILSTLYPRISYMAIRPTEKPLIFSIDTPTDQYLLKIHDPVLSPDAEILDALYDVCSRNKITPRFIPTVEGRFVQVYDNLKISLQERLQVDGVPPDPDQLGQSIRRLHTCLSSISGCVIVNHLYQEIADINTLAEQYGYSNQLWILDRVDALLSANDETQLIHGDLHNANVLCKDNHYYFIDLDSVTSFSPLCDLGLSGYRFFGLGKEKTKQFLLGYGVKNGRFYHHEDLIYFALFNFLQRILYIRCRMDNGDGRFEWDLKNQEAYLSDTMTLLSSL